MTPSRETARSLKLVVVLLLFLPLVSCDTPTVIRGAAIKAYLAGVIVDDVHGQQMSGDPPAPGAGPSVTVPTNIETITGGSSALQMTGSAPFRTVAVFVEGVTGHYLVPLPSDVSTAEAIITIGGLPPVLDFDVVFAVAGADGVFGPYSGISVHAVQAAGGDIQVSVTWNSAADVDLHVVDPNGAEIFYGATTSASGGEFDIDANAACSTSSLTQENVGWAAGSAPTGTYIVRLDYWSACGATQTDYIVTVSLRPGTPSVPGLPGSGVQIFTGTFTGEGDAGGAGSGRFITDFGF